MKNRVILELKEHNACSCYIYTNKREIPVFLQSARILYILMVKYLHLSKSEIT